MTTERTVVYCYHCEQFRDQCEPGTEEGTCAKTEAEAEAYRNEKDSYTPMFMGLVQLRAENAGGKTQQEMHNETVAAYKAAGKEDQLGMKR